MDARTASSDGASEDRFETTDERCFWVIMRNEDAHIAGFHVIARSDEFPVLDARIPNPIHYRSLATTLALALAPSSRTLEQGERMHVGVTLELESERDLRVSVLNDAICLGSTCPPVVDGVLVYRDRHHLTATYARGLAPLRTEAGDSSPPSPVDDVGTLPGVAPS